MCGESFGENQAKGAEPTLSALLHFVSASEKYILSKLFVFLQYLASFTFYFSYLFSCFL